MKKVVLVGVGALGSHVTLTFRNCANITIVDFERVLRKNVLYQVYANDDIGKLKVVVLQKFMQLLFNTKLGAVPHQLIPSNASEIIGNADLLLDCVDNRESRRAIQNFARSRGIPCLHGILKDGCKLGRVVWDENFTIDDGPNDEPSTCENGKFLPFIVVVAANMAYAAQKFLESGQRVELPLFTS
jgi:hypothetical protein